MLWFDPPSTWKERLKTELRGYETRCGRLKISETHSIFIFHRCHAISKGNHITIQTFDIYHTSLTSLFQYPLEQFQELRKFQQHMFTINGIFPKELFPTGMYPQNEEEDVPYDFLPGDCMKHLDDCRAYFAKHGARSS